MGINKGKGKRRKEKVKSGIVLENEIGRNPKDDFRL
jgi:hypothetical protein